jgi:hypothetical protein
MIAKLESGLITFINAVTLANRDLPYHDMTYASSGTTDDHYVVGQNNIDAHGNQSKRFVSKSTLVYSTADTTIRFNDSKNTVIVILGGVWYEFKSNIWQVFYAIPTGEDMLLFYFEGVLPDEARSPE